MATAIIFQPRTQMQLTLLSEMARQMHIAFDYVPTKTVRSIKRELNAKTLAAISEAEQGRCQHFDTVEDYLKEFSWGKDHVLRGITPVVRECHILPDWLLEYRKVDDETIHLLKLIRTGTHSDLFK